MVPLQLWQSFQLLKAKARNPTEQPTPCPKAMLLNHKVQKRKAIWCNGKIAVTGQVT